MIRDLKDATFLIATDVRRGPIPGRIPDENHSYKVSPTWGIAQGPLGHL